MYYIYIIRCKVDTLYTGITTDIYRRMKQHCGLLPGGAKYTLSHQPIAIECLYSTSSRSLASRLECAIKSVSKGVKQQLIDNDKNFEEIFPQLDENEYVRINNYPSLDELIGDYHE